MTLPRFLPAHLGEVLRSARVARGLSIRTLAEKAEVSPMTVQRAEKGEPVRAGSWRNLADAFEIDQELLVGATTRESGPLDVATALGLERASHIGGRVVPHPTMGFSRGADGHVHVSVVNPHVSNVGTPVELTADEQMIADALGVVTHRTREEIVAKTPLPPLRKAAMGPLINLLNGMLQERDVY